MRKRISCILTITLQMIYIFGSPYVRYMPVHIRDPSEEILFTRLSWYQYILSIHYDLKLNIHCIGIDWLIDCSPSP